MRFRPDPAAFSPQKSQTPTRQRARKQKIRPRQFGTGFSKPTQSEHSNQDCHVGSTRQSLLTGQRLQLRYRPGFEFLHSFRARRLGRSPSLFRKGIAVGDLGHIPHPIPQVCMWGRTLVSCRFALIFRLSGTIITATICYRSLGLSEYSLCVGRAWHCRRWQGV